MSTLLKSREKLSPEVVVVTNVVGFKGFGPLLIYVELSHNPTPK
jgi:hypothetical protein